MEPEVIEAPAATVEAPAAEPESTSLAEHQDIFGPQDPTLDAEAKKTNDEARAKVRHRARSQQASPEDAPRIAELTRKLREAEAKLAATPAPPPPARVDQAGPVAAPAAEAGAARQATPPAPTRPKPTVGMVVDGGYESYEAYSEDLTDWKLEQRDAARAAEQQQAQQARQQSESQQLWAKAHATYNERLTAFKATHADYDTLLAQHGAVQLPAAPLVAILTSEHGPAWSYHLMQNPDQLAELALLFDGKDSTDAMIAHATRWLSSRVTPPAAPVTPPALALAPKPPNPIRTGAARTDNDAPGDESMSLAEHEKAYGGRRRR